MINLLNILANLSSKIAGKILDKGVSTSNQIVEIIGVPGSGKTRLKNQILKSFRFIDAQKFRFPAVSVMDTASILDYSPIYKFYLDNQLQQMDGKSRMKKIDFFYLKIFEDRLCLTQNGNLVNDEGLFHHFYDSWIDLAEKDSSLFKQLISNRKFIFLFPSDSQLLQNIKKRKEKDGYIWDGHLHKSDSEIIETSSFYRKRYKSLYSVLKEAGATCLLLEDVDNSFNQVGVFLK